MGGLVTKMMNLRQICAFQAVLQTGSVTLAAEQLYLTQPAVSKLISSFEEKVGYRLFFRERNRLIPTEEAVHLSREVDDVLIALQRLEQAAKEPDPTHSSLIKIASLPGAANYVIPMAVNHLKSQGYSPQLHISTLGSSAVMQKYISSQQYDLAVMQEPLVSPDYDIISVPQPMVCVMMQHDELTNKKAITPADLANKPLVSVGPRHEPYGALVAAFSSYGVKYDPRYEIQTHLPAIGIVANGLAYGLVDSINAWTLKNFLKCDEIVIRPFTPKVVEPLAICSPSLRPLSDAAKLLRAKLEEILQECAQSISF